MKQNTKERSDKVFYKTSWLELYKTYKKISPLHYSRDSGECYKQQDKCKDSHLILLSTCQCQVKPGISYMSPSFLSGNSRKVTLASTSFRCTIKVIGCTFILSFALNKQVRHYLTTTTYYQCYHNYFLLILLLQNCN